MVAWSQIACLTVGAAAGLIGSLVNKTRGRHKAADDKGSAPRSADQNGAGHTHNGAATLASSELPAPQVVTMPHPQWVPGQKQPSPYGIPETYVTFDPSAHPKADAYPLMISAFVPRPIALVSSVGKDGSHNVAPYSYFNAMCHSPPILAIGINRSSMRAGGKKDTLFNIEETGEFVVNIMSDWFVEAANHTCGDFDRGVDEGSLAGLTPLASTKIKAPRIAESAVQMECKLHQVIDINDASGKPSVGIVLGEVVAFHLHPAVAGRSPTGKLVVDPVALRPISRMGGVTYATSGSLFDLGRPSKAEAHAGPALYTPSYTLLAAAKAAGIAAPAPAGPKAAGST